MALPEHILLIYGYLLLFAWVLVEQLGVPLPATPVLLAAGALSAEHELNFVLALLAGLAASLTADSAWFLIGRRYGHRVLRILCKLSLEPTVCVRRTQNSFGRRRAITIMIAKFVPGLATLAPPVAGQNGMAFGSFLLFDAIGATAWLGALLAICSSAIPACSTGQADSPARCSCWESLASWWPASCAAAASSAS
jgi:membrane protein DedA with SNARE-associated domain